MVYPHNFPNKKLFHSFLIAAKKPDGSMHECVSATEKAYRELYDRENFRGGRVDCGKRKSWGDDGINDT